MTKKFDFKKDMKEWKYRRTVLEALLYHSTKKDNFILPTKEEFILSEVVNGTIEYIGGNAGRISYQKSDRNMFEFDIYKYFENEMKNSKRRLNPAINGAITKMVKYEMRCPGGPDRPYPYTEVYSFFRGFGGGGGICPVIMESTFSLPYETVIRIKREVLPSFSDFEIKDIEGIGKSMRKYIKDDLKFIYKD